ncbi:hypothetical protein KR222_001664 [Zaprionus bogoriensis]|nr:hypothetical protein KR222_001664 [Zaprionus bogoriensis]
MDGGGDNQLTDRYSRLRPVNRRVQMILQDYQRWEQPLPGPGSGPGAALTTTRTALLQPSNMDMMLLNRDLLAPLRTPDTEAEDSGFESGSESDVL